MLRYAFAVSFAAGIAAVATSPTRATDELLPQRKAGLWELVTKMDEAGKHQDQKMKLCVDADIERTTAESSLQEHKANCATYEVKREEAKTVVEADCVFSRAKVQSHTVIAGNFQDSFEIKIESSTQPPVTQGAQSVPPIKRLIEQSGTYLGADCGDLKAGEAMTEDGTRVAVP